MQKMKMWKGAKWFSQFLEKIWCTCSILLACAIVKGPLGPNINSFTIIPASETNWIEIDLVKLSILIAFCHYAICKFEAFEISLQEKWETTGFKIICDKMLF